MASWKEIQQWFAYESGDVKAYPLTMAEIKTLSPEEKVEVKRLVSEQIDKPE
jgi:hypothetical protein